MLFHNFLNFPFGNCPPFDVLTNTSICSFPLWRYFLRIVRGNFAAGGLNEERGLLCKPEPPTSRLSADRALYLLRKYSLSFAE